VPSEPVLQEVGRAHGKSAGQVALRWLIDQERVMAVPKAASAERRRENFDIWDFSLTDEERARVHALPKDRREFSPPWAPDWNA
jgi:2,5-diketo-D-gluconate reductase B